MITRIFWRIFLFSQISFFCGIIVQCRLFSGENSLQVVMTYVQSLAFVGVTEHLDDSLKTIRNLLGIEGEYEWRLRHTVA